MAKNTIDEVKEGMKDTNNIRNISVIGSASHGKTVLIDSLIHKAGIKTNIKFMDTREDEQSRSMSIKSTSISLHYKIKQTQIFEENKEEQKTNSYLINLIDTPGNVEFTSEIISSLIITDGSLLVIDSVQGAL